YTDHTLIQSYLIGVNNSVHVLSILWGSTEATDQIRMTSIASIHQKHLSQNLNWAERFHLAFELDHASLGRSEIKYFCKEHDLDSWSWHTAVGNPTIISSYHSCVNRHPMIAVIPTLSGDWAHPMITW